MPRRVADMAREARRRCRCGEGRGKDVGLDRREEDAGARGAEKMSGRERREEDEDAEYEQVVEINLSEVRPTVAFPHLPGNGHTIDEIEEMDKIYIDQVVIGSCTNGRLSDLEKAAAILKGKKIADNVRIMYVPSTQKIFLQCIQKGLAEIFVEAGCAFNTPSCGPCMGGHMGVMAKGEKCVSTTNRNFVGRMGDTEALIYLASPQVAAASAIAGYIANPEKGGNE